MRFSEELNILREVMRTRGSMQTWRDLCVRKKHKDPDEEARQIALAARTAFILMLDRHSHEALSTSRKLGFAFAAIRQVTEATAYRGHEATKTAKKNSGRSEERKKLVIGIRAEQPKRPPKRKNRTKNLRASM